jgi:hypothetical protein
MHRSRLPIANPCGQDWSTMRPDGGGRHCARCDKTVVDLSAMTEAQARTLVARTRRPLCVRYRADASGEVHFRAAPPSRGARGWLLAAGLASLVAGLGQARADVSPPDAPGQGPGGHKPPAAAPDQPRKPPGGVEHPRPPARPAPPPAPPPEEIMGEVAIP